jgi:thioesterase domain-containing protein
LAPETEIVERAISGLWNVMMPARRTERVLSEQQTQAISRSQLKLAVRFEEPIGELETNIAAIFAQSLGVDRVGANDDFFDLDGDSIVAQSVALSIGNLISEEFRISLLADHGTPRKIARYLESSAAKSAKHERPPIFMVHGMRGYMLPRPEFLAGLAPGQKLVMFELPGIRGERPAYDSVEEIAAEYIRQLEAEYPEGPVLLGGYCGGCIITLEMAAQLADKGRPVLQMVLFDPGGSPRSVVENFRRTKGFVRPESAFRRFKHQLRYLRHFLFLGRWTDGSLDEDFSDERLKVLRERELVFWGWFRRVTGRLVDPESEQLSSNARIKMFVAFQHHRPRPFLGPVTIYSSDELGHYFENDRALWVHLLPNRKLHVLGETHADVIQAQAATGAKLMQAVFDSALSSHGRVKNDQ